MSPARQTIIAHLRTGRSDIAAAAAGAALLEAPDDADLHQLAGVVAIQLKQFPVAVARFRRALALNPDLTAAHSNLAFVLLQLGRCGEAIDHARAAIRLQPELPEPHTQLGHALQAARQLPAAVEAHRAALAWRPASAALHGNLAAALQAAGTLPEAVEHHRRALAIEPASALHWTNLGTAWQAGGATAAALDAHRRAIQLDPAFAPAHSNTGVSLLSVGAVDDAVAAHRRSVALQPNLPQSHVNLSLALLTRGDWADGWREYEWRWRSSLFADAARRVAQPRWNGVDASGRTVLLHAEQGLGDTLQFVRLVSRAKQRGGTFLLEAQPELVPLLRHQPWLHDVQILPRRGNRLPDVPFDLHLPLMSLPHVLGCDVPEPCPAYLQPDPLRVEPWRHRLEATPGRRVGLVWAGSPTHGLDRERSVALHQLAPLGGSGAITFVSLQLGPASAQATALPAGLTLLDPTADLHSFADTAALVSQLDAVIAVDTAAAHLAGAMGKPTALLLPFAADFRWGRTEPTTPWYPSVRLFRQPTPGAWEPPIIAAAAWLRTLLVSSPGTPGEG